MASKMMNRRLKMYVEAEEALVTGRAQSYTIGNRTLTYASLAEIREAIEDLLAAGATLEDEPRARRTARVVFMDG